MTLSEDQPWRDPAWQRHTQTILDSFRKWVGRELIERSSGSAEQARLLFEAPFVVVAHNTGPDPILTYGNRVALELWEMNLETLLRTPSRLTAEPVAREERERMLARAAEQGYVDDYHGVRIASSGRRFEIDKAIVWNLVDAAGRAAGQAATFRSWRFLDPD